VAAAEALGRKCLGIMALSIEISRGRESLLYLSSIAGIIEKFLFHYSPLFWLSKEISDLVRILQTRKASSNSARAV